MTGIDVVIKNPGVNPFKRNTANTLTNFQSKVGGNIEVWACANDILMIMNEEGKLLHKEAVKQKDEFIRGERDEVEPSLLPFLIPNFYTGGYDFFNGLEDLIFGPVIFCGDAGDDFGTLSRSAAAFLKKFLTEDLAK